VKGAVLVRTRNGSALPLAKVPLSPFDEFRGALLAELAAGRRLVSFFASPEEGAAAALWAVVADDGPGTLAVGRTLLSDDRFPSLTPAADFFRVEGDEVHEVAVGPVHAGIIEPGHFRFQCHGETGASTSRSRSATSIAASSARWSAGRTGARSTTRRPWRATPRSATPGLLPGGRGARGLPGAGARAGHARRSRWSSSGWPTTSATSARWRATSASCRRRRTAGASAATS
jgi:hypothetical protein